MRRLRRAIFVGFWAIAGFVAWPALWFGVLRFIVYGQRNYGWPLLSRWLPEWADVVIIYGLLGLGTMVVAVAMLMLGLRGRLPGTSCSPLAARAREKRPALDCDA